MYIYTFTNKLLRRPKCTNHISIFTYIFANILTNTDHDFSTRHGKSWFVASLTSAIAFFAEAGTWHGFHGYGRCAAALGGFKVENFQWSFPMVFDGLFQWKPYADR